jgi:hypothetical protein
MSIDTSICQHALAGHQNQQTKSPIDRGSAESVATSLWNYLVLHAEWERAVCTSGHNDAREMRATHTAL